MGNLQNQTIYNGVNENNENVLVNNGANAGSDGMDTNESTSTTSPNRSENEIPSPPPQQQQQVEFSNYAGNYMPQQQQKQGVVGVDHPQVQQLVHNDFNLAQGAINYGNNENIGVNNQFPTEYGQFDEAALAAEICAAGLPNMPDDPIEYDQYLMHLFPGLELDNVQGL